MRPTRPVSTFGVLVLAWSGLPSMAQADATGPLETLVVTISREALPEDRTVAPVVALDREVLDLRQASQLDDLLRGLAGVTAEGGPRQAALQPNIRGLGEGRVVMRLDGARQNMNIRHRGQSFIDPALLRRVEIWRGPASTLHGSGAIGGVVSLHTLDPEDLVAPGRELGGRATLGYHDNGDQRFGAATVAARRGDLGLLASVSRRRAGDFRAGDGDTIDFTGSDVLGTLGKVTWQDRDTQRVTLTWLGFDDQAESLLTADRPTGVNIDRRVRQQTGSLRYEFRPAASALRDLDLTVYRTDLTLDERLRTTGDRQENQLETTGLDLANGSDWQIGRIHHRITWGTEFYRDRQRGTENGLPREGFASASQHTLGMFLQDRVSFDGSFELVAGLRYDRIRQQADRAGAEDNRLGRLSTQLALEWPLSDALRAYAGRAEAFRAPALRELYIGGQHFPGNQYLPNPDLRAERARNLELGLVYARRDLWHPGDALQLRASGFRNTVEDFIEQVVQATTTRFENVEDARVRGLELELRYRTPRSQWLAAAAVQRGDDRGSGLPLESIPADSLSLEGALRQADDAWLVGARATLVRAQRRVPEGPFTIDATPGYALFDLFLRWTLASGTTLHAGVDNVLDADYRAHLTQLSGRGRGLRLQLQHPF